MDITIDRRKRKKELGSTSQTSSGDKRTGDIKNKTKGTFEVDGKIYPLPPDYDESVEFDWGGPENQWFVKKIEEESRQREKKYGKLTVAQSEAIYKETETLMACDSSLSRKKAYNFAWEKVTGKKLL